MWTKVDSGTTTKWIRAVWGTGRSDVWAVGEDLIWHWDGSSWTSEVIDLWLDSVWGRGPTDVWAGGLAGAMAHWDGTAWTSVSNGWYSLTNGLWGSGPDDEIWAATREVCDLRIYPDYCGGIWYWTGARWRAAVINVPFALSGVWGTAATDVWAVGDGGAILHWDGFSWTSAPSPTTNGLRGIWGTGADVWVVGENGTILRR